MSIGQPTLIMISPNTSMYIPILRNYKKPIFTNFFIITNRSIVMKKCKQVPICVSSLFDIDTPSCLMKMWQWSFYEL